MVGGVIGAAGLAAAASIAFAGHALSTSPAATGTVSPFGGSVPVRLAHVGRIELDLERAPAAGLRRVPCASGAATSACFVARR
jgi:hypothetical protein